jgi:chorismate dehydratase
MLLLPNRTLTEARTTVLPRLGQINFVNCLPITVPLLRSDLCQKADIVMGTPTELNGAFAEGLLDIGVMSSFHYLRSSDIDLMPGLSISSRGAVGSVVCYSKVELNKLDKARVAVPHCSATSINLLLVLLAEVFGVEPKLVYEDEPNVEDADIQAALVIGDRALAVEESWSKRFVRADLGEWWRINFDLPMVFAVWGARGSFVQQHGEQFVTIVDALRNSVKAGLGPMFQEVLQEACRRTAMSEERMRYYFTQELDFALGDRHLMSLELYRSFCEKHGLIKRAKSRR